MTFYREVKDEEGNVSYEPIEVWDEQTVAELPEDAVAHHPKHKEVLTETVKRRKRIGELQQQMDTLNAKLAAVDEDEPEDAGEPDPQKQEPAATIDPTELADSVVRMVMERFQQQTQAADEENAELQALQQEHKLDDTAMALLREFPRAKRKAQAPLLSAMSRRFDSDAPDGGLPFDINKVRSKMGLSE